MKKEETMLLLQECDAGLKMAISSIDEVLDTIQNQEFKQLSIDIKNRHQKLKEEVDYLLKKYEIKEKEASLMAKSMSWMKKNFKIAMDHEDSTVASLLFQGCAMGVESLYHYLHVYQEAHSKIKDIALKLIKIEEDYSEQLKNYLWSPKEASFYIKDLQNRIILIQFNVYQIKFLKNAIDVNTF